MFLFIIVAIKNRAVSNVQPAAALFNNIQQPPQL
jgi:hypothetical protein